MLKKRFISENLTLSYEDVGQGEAIVLLHGFCGSHAYWERIMPELAKQYRVIAPDLRGHGGSTYQTDEYAIEDMAEDIKLLLEALNINKVSMFGHSLGGYITLAFVEHYSSMLNSFSLIHSTAFADSDEAIAGREANIKKVEKDGVDPLINGLVPKLFSENNVMKMKEEVAYIKEIGYKTSKEGTIGALNAMKNRPNRNEILEHTSLPVLLVAGEQDRIISTANVFSTSKDNVTQSLIKNVGHMSMFEDSEQLLSDIKSFLS
ncbi:alpha/beta hydrolase [Cytobacillus sp. IB215316]|uniref:alpha/beta fold hydrolase n=1 Tax=Cytobacillus sp. IB215316 TaxID=3097354 RepID=UPI002A18481D|nr:alpha/beta hydrolase [Cytobacillus sp. IB215316]MDX8359691.1 alpha/beta hydrolase [Cytobacillus sp. IB215316]